MAEITFLPIPDDDRIRYCIDIILKEAKLEDVLVKQLFYHMLSMYSNDPRNIAVNSPSGEGKNYVIRKVADLFPKEDVIKFVGMSEKSLFHRGGKLVVKDANGEYVDIEETLERIDEDIENKESESTGTTDRNLKRTLRAQIKGLEHEKRDLYKEAKKLIDLSHKTIIFLDTPPEGLLSAIMSLLSHDEYEVEYDYVDTNNGIKTRSNVLRGWPVFIFAQAVDFSHHKRWPEIQRRFTITNPRMDKEKYAAAIDLLFDKYCNPDFIYQKLVVSDEQKEQAREIIKGLREKISDLTSSIEPGRNNVCIPFKKAIRIAASSDRASDMTFAERILGYLTLLAQVNVDRRPVVLFRRIGRPVTEKIPIATFADLDEALFLMQYSNGIRPYILEWYKDVFLPTYDKKIDPDFSFKWIGNKQQEVRESRVAITSQQLADATFKIKSKKLSAKQIRESYLFTLINEGYVDSIASELDRRGEIYFPVIRLEQGEKEKKRRSAVFTQSPTFDPQTDIRSSILALREVDSEKAVVNIENIDTLMEYFEDPEKYFGAGKTSREDENKKNVSEDPNSKSTSLGAENEPRTPKEGQKYEIDQERANSPTSTTDEIRGENIGLSDSGDRSDDGDVTERSSCSMECGQTFSSPEDRIQHLRSAHGEIFHD